MPSVPGVRFLPNAITVLALCSGLTSVAFAYRGSTTGSTQQYFLAVGAIAAAAILDSLDGPTARLLRSTSRIGAELDSLSDLISFGVAPALVMYLWELHRHPIGWAVCLVYAVCTALRLARFNSLLDDENPKPWAKGFFLGVPSPAGALLACIPLLMWIRFGDGWWSNGWLAGIWLLLVGLLMVSRISSIALKSVRVPPTLIAPLLVLLVAGVAVLFYEPEIVHHRRPADLPAAPAVRRVEVPLPRAPPGAVEQCAVPGSGRSSTRRLRHVGADAATATGGGSRARRHAVAPRAAAGLRLRSADRW